MRITHLSSQLRNPDRINVSIDGRYRLSLDVSQVVDLGVRVGREVSDEELAQLEIESQYGKLYALALEYSLLRPRSLREMRDYLRRKTQTRKKLVATRLSSNQNISRTATGEASSSERQVIEIPGYSPALAERVLSRLQHRGYVDDEKFARWWVESRNLTKGTSLRKLRAELAAKGVDRVVVEAILDDSERSDASELAKIVAKKRTRYPDNQKFMQYLARQGFSYDDIKSALEDNKDG